MKRCICRFTLLWLLVGGRGQARADYLFTTLDGIYANGINDNGQVVGYFGYPLGSFLYSNGTYTLIKVPVAPTFPPDTTVAQGVNNAGQIVGFYGDAGGTHGFLRSGSGVYSSFDVPGFVGSTYAYGINNTGQIVGACNVGQFGEPSLGFLLSGGSYTKVLPPGSTSSWLYGINDHSQIVGGDSTALPPEV